MHLFGNYCKSERNLAMIHFTIMWKIILYAYSPFLNWMKTKLTRATVVKSNKITKFI